MKLSNKGKHRLFFAIDFDESFKMQIQQAIALKDINGRRVPFENYHITTLFLGQVSNHQVFDVVDSIKSPNIPPFQLSIKQTGYFSKNQILFLNVEDGVESIIKLSRCLKVALQTLEYLSFEKRKLHPHVTIARDVKPPVDIFDVDLLNTTVSNFSLMESIQTKSGIYYETVESWPIYQPTEKEILLGTWKAPGKKK